jgi:predicted dehydrogenase
MNAIIIGSGSYVLEDSFGSGVILPSLLAIKEITSIQIGVRTPKKKEFWDKVKQLQEALGTNKNIKEFNVKELSKLYKENTIAFIVTPDETHYEYAKYFIEQKIPTYIVKPLTGNGKQSKELVKLAKKNNVKLWVDYHKRFDMSNKKIKQYIDTNKFGKMSIYSVQYSQPSSMPLENINSWAKNVDVFQYIGCHYVDQIFYLYPNCEPIRISSTGFSGNLINKSDIEYDTIHTIIDFKVDDRVIRGDFNISWNDPTGSSSKSHQRLDIQFEKGRIIADQKERGLQVWDDIKTNEINPYFFQIIGNEVSGYGFESIKSFISDEKNNDYPYGYNTYKMMELNLQ